ncbi:hypothetical protein FGG08_006906 [Glutinoglossum americanum]|uniref:Uncharacterized protein n=1 Tax=Glutinoglossum americanum TaxID=1670608 RepID=A0A9P8L0I7_9PEZI|nr:hypothetical protein FGG08_006906 [Glutinoglossum americanum]
MSFTTAKTSDSYCELFSPDRRSRRESFTTSLDFATAVDVRDEEVDGMGEGVLSGYEGGSENEAVEKGKPKWWENFVWPKNPYLEDSWYNPSDPGFCESGEGEDSSEESCETAGGTIAIPTNTIGGNGDREDGCAFAEGERKKHGPEGHVIKKDGEGATAKAGDIKKLRKGGIRKNRRNRKSAKTGVVKTRLLEILRQDADGTRRRIGRTDRVEGWLTSLPDDGVFRVMVPSVEE